MRPVRAADPSPQTVALDPGSSAVAAPCRGQAGTAPVGVGDVWSSAATGVEELPVTDRWCRAYCGPAHGRSWPAGGSDVPVPTTALRVGDELVRYRLVLHPRTRRPARDHLGNYPYVPVPVRLAPRTTAP